jgi:membrane-associated phospholipid phosphatase
MDVLRGLPAAGGLPVQSSFGSRALLCALCLTLGGRASAQEVGDRPPDLGPDLSRFLPREDLERDGRRTLGQFPKNLGKSFVGVFAKDNLAPFLAGSAFAGGAFLVDSHAQDALRGQAPTVSKAASKAGGLTYMVPATLGLFAAGRFAEGSRFRAFSYDATQAIVVNAVYTDLLKRAVTRTRPDGSNNLSFPSGHTSTAFAWATVANAHYGWKAGVPSYLAASAIGLSRVTNDRHHLSDVLAGATIGIVTGRTVVRTNGAPVGRQRVFNLHPMTDAQGTGVGLGATLSW